MIETMAPPPSSSYAPAPSPYHRRHHHHHHHHVASSPTISISTMTSSNNQSSPSSSSSSQSNSKLTTVDFSPPLIAMVVVVATAFLVITYSRLISRYLLRILRRYRMWRRRRRFLHRYVPSSNGDIDSPPALFESPDGFHVYSPYGLDESVIKTIPLSLYYATKNNNNTNNNNDNYYCDFDSNNQNYNNNNNSFHKQTVTANANNKDCAVCLLEFEDNDYVRTLPVCSHAFHVDCIDIWLRSHANCPLCRAGIFRPESPFIPVMAARIRPSFDDSLILHRMSSAALDTILQSPSPIAAEAMAVTEITPCIDEASPRRNSDDQFFRFNGGRENFLLKRSYSFGFERSSASERMMVMEAATASPWRYRRGGGGSFWSKRPSPFGSLSKSRVFSFRYYRGMKSPAFFRRRGSSGLFPLSERFSTAGIGGGGSGSGWGSSSRRSKSMASPMFLRSSVGSGLAVFSSSRLRCGDPEALLSPERFNRR